MSLWLLLISGESCQRPPSISVESPLPTFGAACPAWLKRAWIEWLRSHELAVDERSGQQELF